MAPKKKKGKGKKGAAKEVSPKEQELQRFQTENELLKLQVAKQIGLSRRAQAGTIFFCELIQILWTYFI